MGWAGSTTPVTEDGPTKGLPRIETDIDAGGGRSSSLAPETNGAGRGQGLGGARRRSPGAITPHLAETREDEKIRFRDVQAQPRKIITLADLVAASRAST